MEVGCNAAFRKGKYEASGGFRSPPSWRVQMGPADKGFRGLNGFSCVPAGGELSPRRSPWPNPSPKKYRMLVCPCLIGVPFVSSFFFLGAQKENRCAILSHFGGPMPANSWSLSGHRKQMGVSFVDTPPKKRKKISRRTDKQKQNKQGLTKMWFSRFSGKPSANKRYHKERDTHMFSFLGNPWGGGGLRLPK